jgi:hypothetical protein
MKTSRRSQSVLLMMLASVSDCATVGALSSATAATQVRTPFARPRRAFDQPVSATRIDGFGVVRGS